MLNELAKIIEILEIPNSDPVAERLRRRGLAFYRADAVMELKAEIEQPSENGWNETQEFRAVSYLFFSCIKSHYGKYEEAIKAASNALETIRLTRGGEFNEGLAHWFRGTLYNLANDNRSAMDDFEEAVSILDERAHAFERECNYRKKFHCIKLMRQITSRVPPEWFSEIIGRLVISEDDSLAYELWMTIRYIERSNPKFGDIETIIEKLKNILVGEIERISSAAPFIIIFLAHCYKLGFYTGEGEKEYPQKALRTANERLDDYIGDLNEYNQSLLRIYLGLLYYDVSDVKNALSHLKESNYLLERVLIEGNDIDTEDIQNLQMEIQDWIIQFESEVMYARDEIPESQETQHPKVGFSERISTFVKHILNNTSEPEETLPAPNKIVYGNELPSIPRLEGNNARPPNRTIPPGTPRNPSDGGNSDPNVRLLVVPVDLRALEKTEINDTFVTQDDIEKLKEYDREYANQRNHTQPSSKPNSTNLKRIPRFPIYGNVSAGPNGEAILLTPDEFAEEIDDKSVLINNQKYQVGFIASPIPDFVLNKKYGWLKVTGESMNKATPIPILPNDYVLFCKNHSLDACAKKIVVALVADMESQPPRPMVKWLLKMSGEAPCETDGYSPEECKFMLRSQSSLEIDPITGKSFKKDIEIENDYQLVGEVIAIAKRL